jgi:hypothetical protein
MFELLPTYYIFWGNFTNLLEVWSFLQIPHNVKKPSLTPFELSIVLNLDQFVQIMAQNFKKKRSKYY